MVPHALSFLSAQMAASACSGDSAGVGDLPMVVSHRPSRFSRLEISAVQES